MNFFGRIFSGIAYGFGFGIGLTIWNILKKLIKLSLIAGGIALATHWPNHPFLGIDKAQIFGWLHYLQ